MAIEMVLAHGDNGQELTPAHEVVEIPALVFAPGNRPIPQTIRALPFRWGRPVRLLGIRRVGVPWPLVRWRDDRGETNCCFVRNLAEAVGGKPRPVGPELKFQRDAGHHAEGKAQGEYFGPETSDRVIVRGAAPQGLRPHIQEQQGQPHRELRKQIVKRRREGELQPIVEKCARHGWIQFQPRRISAVKLP